jgi:hypothetical protein
MATLKAKCRIEWGAWRWRAVLLRALLRIVPSRWLPGLAVVALVEKRRPRRGEAILLRGRIVLTRHPERYRDRVGVAGIWELERRTA